MPGPHPFITTSRTASEVSQTNARAGLESGQAIKTRRRPRQRHVQRPRLLLEAPPRRPLVAIHHSGQAGLAAVAVHPLPTTSAQVPRRRSPAAHPAKAACHCAGGSAGCVGGQEAVQQGEAAIQRCCGRLGVQAVQVDLKEAASRQQRAMAGQQAGRQHAGA